MFAGDVEWAGAGSKRFGGRIVRPLVKSPTSASGIVSVDGGDMRDRELHIAGVPMRRVRHPSFGALLGVNSDPTGGSVYDAALCLCFWLESESGRAMVPIVGRVVVELGAGPGVVGLAAGRLGAHR